MALLEFRTTCIAPGIPDKPTMVTIVRRLRDGDRSKDTNVEYESEGAGWAMYEVKDPLTGKTWHAYNDELGRGGSR